MVDKSIGAHVGGPEDRVVSAKMGKALYIGQLWNDYSDVKYTTYDGRFTEATGTQKTYVDDLVAKNWTIGIQDSPYSAIPLLGGPIRINTHVFVSVGGGVFYSDREVFVKGVAIFSPRTPTYPGIHISSLSFRKILGVAPIASELVAEDTFETCLYVYYFLNDRKSPVSYETYGWYDGAMTKISGPVTETQHAYVHILCCDRYVKRVAGWELDTEGSRIVNIPAPWLENGTALGARVAVTAATSLVFSGSSGVSVVSIRSIAARAQLLAKGGDVYVVAHVGASHFNTRSMNDGHCPRYFSNTNPYFYSSWGGSPMITMDYVYSPYIVYSIGIASNMGSPTAGWQEERNYILTVNKATAVFALDENRLVFSVTQAGGSPSGKQSIYSMGASRLMSTFRSTIYVPGA